jgi:hypothetical protein
LRIPGEKGDENSDGWREKPAWQKGKAQHLSVVVVFRTC